MSLLDRRGFLASLPTIAALGRWDVGGTAPGRFALEGFGIQLYTLRDLMAEDVEGTLAALAEMGFAEVELAGLYGRTPAQMRAALDAVGLKAASSHQSIQEVRGDWARVLEGAQTLGQSLVVVSGLPGDERTPEALRRVADDFNRAGEAASRAGLRFGYHNHDWELRPLADGSVPIDLLMERTDRNVVDWQMDIFWTVHGGAEPERKLRNGRVTSVHVKDRTAAGEMVDVGQGEIDFASILNLAETYGLRHAFVEHDRPADPLETARLSLAHLKLLRGGA